MKHLWDFLTNETEPQDTHPKFMTDDELTGAILYHHVMGDAPTRLAELRAEKQERLTKKRRVS